MGGFYQVFNVSLSNNRNIYASIKKITDGGETVSRWANKYVIGLTGNIATGKSVVRQMLQHLGAYTIDADGLTNQAMSPGAPAYKPVVEVFGQFILNPDKTINRAMLGRIVFSNKEALTRLEEATHPIISQAINTLVSRANQKVVVIEAIKLLEGDLKDYVDVVWTVNAKPQTQYARLISKQRKMSPEDAKQRIIAQGSPEAKLKAANLIIQNDGNIEDTWKQVQKGFTQISAQAPAAPAEKAATPPAAELEGIVIKRGMPTHAEVIAGFINRATGKNIERMDVLMAFGQKSYLVINDEAEKQVGIVGWQVENLITCVDDLYLNKEASTPAVVQAIIKHIEVASQELQSEVCFVFLPAGSGDDMSAPFLSNDYEATTIKEIKIPAWRESVQNNAEADTIILTKKLRQNRVLKPI